MTYNLVISKMNFLLGKMFVLLGCLCQLVSWINGCPNMTNADVDHFEYCETTLKHSTSHLYVKCYLHSWTETLNPYLPNTTIGITAISTFTTSQPINLTDHDPTLCLRMVFSHVRKINPIQDQSFFRKSNKFTIPQIAMLPLITLKEMELKVRFRSDRVFGSVRYNSSCVRDLIRSPSAVDELAVSQCVFEVIVRRVHFDGDRKFNINQFLNADTLTKYFNFIFDKWIYQLNGTVEYTSLTIFEQVPEFPKYALSVMSNRPFEALHFPNNKIEKIKNDDLPSLPSLQTLSFKGCRLQSIESQSFQTMTNLIYLNLAENQLKEIPQALTPLINLEILDMNSNQVDVGRFNYAPNVIGQLSKLKFLDLSYLPLMKFETQFNSTNKTTLKFLQVLNLTGDSLHQFPEPFIEMFPNLEIVLLTDNLIVSEKSLIANTWPRLQTLELNENKLNDDVNCTFMFNHFPKLELLNLAKNSIKELSDINIANAGNQTRFLNLSGNNIKLWNEFKFRVAKPNRLDIDITENNISEVTPTMLTGFSKLNRIYLTGNPFDCHSCELDKFQGWLKDNWNSTDHERSPYKCVFPKQSVGLLVADIIFDPYLCLFNWLLNVVIPITVIVVTSIVIGFLVFHYRWHLRYLWYIWKAKWTRLRNKRVDGAIEYRYDAFVSYSGSESEWVASHLVPMLEEVEPKLHLCVHERDFLIGEAVINNVIKCIDISRKSIFLLSNSFMKSTWCQWELHMAQHKLFEDKKDVLVLIVLEELVKSEIPREVQRIMATTTYHVWPANRSPAATKLFWSRLRQCIGPCHCLQKILMDRGITFR